jgi:hypothetical protein
MNDAPSGRANQATSADVNSPLSGQPIYGYLPPMTVAESEFEEFSRAILSVPRSEADAAEANRQKRGQTAT